MKPAIRIITGSYENNPVQDISFNLINDFRPYKQGGGFYLVDGKTASEEGYPKKPIRIKVKDPASAEYIALEQPLTKKKVKKSTETEPDAIARIKERFDILTQMVEATQEGVVRAMIVSGPPGVGKSYGITTQLQKASMFDNLQGQLRWEVVKGATSAIGLYKKLWKYSNAGNVLVFDDCDAVLYDDLSLNILKAALDSGKKRIIQWNTESRVLQQEGIPDQFEFKGSVIFVTNIKFDFVKSKKLQDHLGALMSRCHYIDLALDTVRDKMLRIKQVLGNGMLDGYKLPVDKEQAKQDIIEYLESNVGHLRELSLRTALKLADLRVLNGERWKLLADTTILRRGI